jgi:amino acid permease
MALDGLAGINWSAWPREGTTFAEAMTAIAKIVFAYAFAVAMPSFMDEMHTPVDFRKSIVAVGIIEIGIYTFTVAILHAFVGQDVQSPALLSANDTFTHK